MDNAIVIGGGIGGLSIAARLLHDGFNVKLYESFFRIFIVYFFIIPVYKSIHQGKISFPDGTFQDFLKIPSGK